MLGRAYLSAADEPARSAGRAALDSIVVAARYERMVMGVTRRERALNAASQEL